MVTEQFFTDEYLKNAAKVAAYLRRKCGDCELAKDLSQTAWAKAWKYREQFRGDCSFLTWVVSIANSVWRDYLRYKKPVEQFAKGFDASSSERIDDDAIYNQYAEMLEKMVDLLGSIDRTIVILAKLNNVPLEEVARKVGLNENTVKTRSRRAVEKLRTMVARA